MRGCQTTSIQASIESLSSEIDARSTLKQIDDEEVHQAASWLGAKNHGSLDRGKHADYSSDTTRFTIIRPHTAGGLGEVFFAKDNELDREVAFKQVKGQYANSGAHQARFLLEAIVTGGLEHPGIVPVYSPGHYGDGQPYSAMRFIRGD